MKDIYLFHGFKPDEEIFIMSVSTTGQDALQKVTDKINLFCAQHMFFETFFYGYIGTIAI